MDAAVQRTLGGRYALDSLLATGGMGQVWRGRDTLLGRPVAVKVLRSEYTGDPTFLGRFRAEAQHTAALSHRNIATLYDYGEVRAADGTGEQLAYLVMELVEGEPLSALLAREGALLGPRDPRAAAPDRGRAGRRARRGRRPPRRQAGQRAGRRGRRRQDHRLRHRVVGVGRAAHPDRPGGRHRALPLPGAGRRRQGQPGQRRLRPRDDRLRVPRGPARLRRRQRRADRAAPAHRRARPAARRRARPAALAGRPGAAEGPPRALRRRRRLPRRGRRRAGRPGAAAAAGRRHLDDGAGAARWPAPRGRPAPPPAAAHRRHGRHARGRRGARRRRDRAGQRRPRPGDRLGHRSRRRGRRRGRPGPAPAACRSTRPPTWAGR